MFNISFFFRLDIKVRIISMINFPTRREGKWLPRLILNLIDVEGRLLRAVAWNDYVKLYSKNLKVS